MAALSLSIALLFASQADKNLKAAQGYKTFLIWPYAVAWAIAGVLWMFLFNPTLGVVTHWLRPLGITDAALSLMSAYDWPGNVRELENVIQRALVMHEEGVITPADLLINAATPTVTRLMARAV